MSRNIRQDFVIGPRTFLFALAPRKISIFARLHSCTELRKNSQILLFILLQI